MEIMTNLGGLANAINKTNTFLKMFRQSFDLVPHIHQALSNELQFAEFQFIGIDLAATDQLVKRNAPPQTHFLNS